MIGIKMKMIDAFGLRYSDLLSVNGDATRDMEIGRETNMIGFGVNDKAMNGAARPGRNALVVPNVKTLAKTKIGYIHFVTDSDGIDVWKSQKQYVAKKALFIGEILLTDQEIALIAKCGQRISNKVASMIVTRFYSTR